MLAEEGKETTPEVADKAKEVPLEL